ncbi:hypothetical protein ACRE_074920 [Hapsidospora chrysogenum ATCC 11550]|uniref:Uncharacterized protein n=1 Tax=Hapsidospora chrysogenum (strain ATCC 11550 / CBS 779.69 / DSM 880 / IAM 14645 / JCM 23072 / IMI 49137) TaxID=857340 RepID=A0A086SXH4_HAPC1|nr:hypothetical protein ACRE_074920 [Hapsidospora chrysogenum ATCC 11550]
MAPKSFCEWVVGTSIESAMRPGPRRPRRRSIVRLEVSTDDETEEDSIKLTYPRTGHAGSRPKKRRPVVKKVRFQDAPPKSALKKTTATTTTPDTSEESDETATTESTEATPESTTDEASSEASASCETSSAAESSDEPSQPSPPAKPKRKSKKQKKKAAESESSDNDSDPHPTCKCKECVRGRQVLKKQGKKGGIKQKQAAESVAEPSDSDAVSTMSKAKSRKKGKKATVESESEGQASESAPDTTSEEEPPEPPKKVKEKTGGGKKKQKQPKGEDAQQGGNAAKEKATNKNEERQAESSRSAKRRDGQKKGYYPEAFPGPHPRRPYYIEPVRAEVVQTERVIETPEDPRPNAYYDAEHNIIRVYHGPVWGGNPNQSLYPRRDPSLRPLPIGMPHPTKNHYYYGFNNPPPQQQQGVDSLPVTQGMPTNAWTSMCPPQGYQAGYPYGPIQDRGMYGQEPSINAGAFHQMSGANGLGPSKDKDKAGENDAAPGSIKSGKDNPYYTRKTKSQFSDWGGNTTKGPNAPTGDNNATGDNVPTNGGAWQQPNDTNTNDNNNINGNDNNQAAWGGDANAGDNNENVGGQLGDNTGHSGDANTADPTTTMPGAWGDTTAAADTGGQVDNVNW